MPEELGAQELEILKQDAQYALFMAETGEQLTEWVTPDDSGQIEFPLGLATEDYEVEIGMLLLDGTLLLGERTTIEV